MSRAEERAMEAYPEHWKFNKNATGTYDRNFQRRKSFIDGYEAAEKETIERVCKWLEEHFVDMSHYSDRGSFGRIETTDFDSMEEMVNDLKKALEEQK